MAAFVRFEKFSEDLAEKVHNLDTDILRIYLSNTTPNVATHTVKADLAEIAGGNGYTAGGEDTLNLTSRAGLVTSVVGTDVVWTGSGAGFGPARYVVLYNNTAVGNPLIGYWDRGESVTVFASETWTTDFGASMFTVG